MSQEDVIMFPRITLETHESGFLYYQYQCTICNVKYAANQGPPNPPMPTKCVRGLHIEEIFEGITLRREIASACKKSGDDWLLQHDAENSTILNDCIYFFCSVLLFFCITKIISS
jgi:hypothetical protein